MDTDGPPERLRLIYGEVLTNSSPPPLSVLLSSSPFMSSPIPTATTNGNINSAHILNNANKLAALGSQQCQPQSGDNNYNNGIRQNLNPHALTFIQQQQQQQLNLGYSHPPPGLAPIMSPGLYSNSNSHGNGGSGGGGMINHPPPGLSQAPLSPHCNAPPGFYYPPTQNPTHLYEIPHHQPQHPHPHQSFGTGAQNNNSNGNSSSALYSRPIMPVQAQPQNQNHQQHHHQQQQQQQHQFPPHYASPMYLQQQQHVQLPTSQGQGLPLRGNKMAVGESNGNVSSPLGHGPMGGMNMDQYDYELNPRLARLTGAGTSNTTTPNNETIGSGKISATAGPGCLASGLPVGKPMIEPMIENIVGSMSGSTNGTYTHFGPITPGGGIARGPISGGSGGGSASASVVTSTVHLPSRVIGSTSTSFGNEGPGKGHVLAFNSVVSNTMGSNNNNSNNIGSNSNSKPVLLSESSGKIIAAGVSTVKKAAIVSPSFSGNSSNSNSSVNLKEKLGIVHPRVIGKESPVHSPAEKPRTVSPKEGGSDSRPQTPGKPSYSEILVKNEPKGGSNVPQQKGALTSHSPLPLTAASIARKNSLQLQSDFRDKSPSSSSSSCSSPVTKPKLSMLTGDSTKYTNNYKGKENSNSSSLSSSSKSSTTKSTPNGTPTHNNSSSFSGNNTTHKSSSSRKTSYSGSGGSGNERKILTGSFTNGNNGTSSTNNEKNRENQSQKTTGAGNNKMPGRTTLSSNNSSSNSFQFEFDIEDLDDIHEKMGSGWSTKGQSGPGKRGSASSLNSLNSCNGKNSNSNINSSSSTSSGSTTKTTNSNSASSCNNNMNNATPGTTGTSGNPLTVTNNLTTNSTNTTNANNTSSSSGENKKTGSLLTNSNSSGSNAAPATGKSVRKKEKHSSRKGETERRIKANDPVYNSRFNYANNLIKTSKYSVLTFLPLNLFEQFQRLANFYFLCLLVLQVIPVISSLTPFTTAVPLILVLALTAIKDAYDDFQRHRSDSQVNNRKSLVLRNGLLQQERWHTVQVGDVIRMENDQFVAADVLLISSSEPNGLTFIETAELDGETNLKCRQCLVETAGMGEDPEKLGYFKGEIICEPPNNHLNKFDGTLTWEGKKFPLDNDKVLLRGCILRNTQWCYGVVLFAGRDTKLMQNSGKTKFKRTSIDRLLNFIILGIVFFLLSMCLFCTIACAVWETMIGRWFRKFLPWDALIPTEPVEGAVIISLLVFFSYAIILNTVVPISLYVSVEVIRLLQSFLINWDLKMYHEPSDTPARARTTTLNEELGQIEYIFSDKTGTLTQNIMAFNKATIGGKSYGEVIDPQTGEVMEHLETNEESGVIDVDDEGASEDEVTLRNTLSNASASAHANMSKRQRQHHHTHLLCGTERTTSPDFESHELLQQPTTNNDHDSATTDTNIPLQSMRKHNVAPIDFSKNPHYEAKFKFYDRSLYDAVRNGDQDVHMFFRHLALCHTVMAEERNGNLEYQAQSPDESALVSAARNFEFVFKERSPDSITISVLGQEEVYDLLCILDFNNVRKRMSVVVKSRDGRILLLCKGADSIIYERLEMGSEDIKSRTQEHLNKFAGEGLRTLVVAVKDLTPEYFDDWKRRHHEAASSLNNRDDKLDAIYEEIERDMTLVGATAIEDKLQDGVPSTIANLVLAGIKVWVLTGDKQETAINIGYSCQLLTDEMNDIFIVDAYSFEDVKSQLLKYLDALQKGSCVPVENQRMGDMSMVTFSESEYGPGYHPGDGDSSHDQEGNGGYAIVVNGHSLVHALNPQLEQLYLELASNCKAVICCRVTPLQKALVVELVKKYKKAVTLAIGDGANDVSMIKTAHIGVGVSGQEGLQAVLAADYSIAQFRYLERLLLVHGRWSYYRMAKFLRYFFYKNFAFTLSHFWYAFFCGFSAQTVFDPMFISVYNLFYTSLPVLSIGVFDQDCNDEYSLRYPKLYTPGHRNLLFNKKEFFKSALHGFVTSCVLFIVPYGTYNHAISANGQGVSDHMLFGSAVSTILVVVVTAQVALDTSYWTVFNHVTIWGSLLFFFVLHYLYNFIIQGKYLGSLTKALQEASFWFTLVLTVMILLIPVLAWRFYFHDVHPTLSDRVRLKQRVSSAKTRHAGDKAFRTPSARRSRRSLRSSYAFAHQEGFGPLITSGKIMRKAKSNNNHTAGSTVASLVSSVTSFGTSTNPAISSSLSKSPRITMVSPQDPKQYQDSVRL